MCLKQYRHMKCIYRVKGESTRACTPLKSYYVDIEHFVVVHHLEIFKIND
jgi:hypothetical protein